MTRIDPEKGKYRDKKHHAFREAVAGLAHPDARKQQGSGDCSRFPVGKTIVVRSQDVVFAGACGQNHLPQDQFHHIRRRLGKELGEEEGRLEGKHDGAEGIEDIQRNSTGLGADEKDKQEYQKRHPKVEIAEIGGKHV